MKYSPKDVSVIEPGEFIRPMDGPVWVPESNEEGLPYQQQPAWQSNGGVYRGHPARSCPYGLDVLVPAGAGPLLRVHLVGVFALWADREAESPGTLGASIHFTDSRDILHRQDLVNSRHYWDARDLEDRNVNAGDGAVLRTIGRVDMGGSPHRVDVLTVEVPSGVAASHLRFKDLGSPASFLLFDVFFESKTTSGCPFHSRSGGVSLSELSAVIRMNDRVKLGQALEQLQAGVLMADDLDEARGQALTFLAVVTAGMLEQGGSRQLHRVQLDAARRLDETDRPEEIAQIVRDIVQDIARPLFTESQAPSGHLVNRALQFVDRHYARDLSDAYVASQLGLSTSHFRYLFKQATGQPFHKYVMAMRLEKAKSMLLERELPVTEVAKAVGFTGLSHFSRAFAQRFSVSPSELRRSSQ